MLRITQLDSCEDNLLNLAGEIYLHSAGDKQPESTGEDDSTLVGKPFRLRWGNDSTRGILYSAREHSYIMLRNIKFVGDALILAGEYLYTPLGNI